MTVLTLPVVDPFGEDPYVLPDNQKSLVQSLLNDMATNRVAYDESEKRYNASNYVKQIGIAADPRLRGIETATGWARLAVESVVERLTPLGVRMPNQVDSDQELWDIWQANNLDEECELVHYDAAIFGCSYVTVGTGDDPSTPLVAIESPLTMSCRYDARTRKLTSALRQVDEDNLVLYLPNETIWLTNGTAGWTVMDTDQHNLGRVPVVRFANRQRAHDRGGQSEITEEVRRISDQACRTLLNLAIAGEYYSAPQKYLLGVSQSDFVDADGNPVSPIDAMMGKILALPGLDDGDGITLPQVGQFTAYDPSTFTNVLDWFAKQMSSVLALPAHYLGFTTENPASAEAIASSQERLLKRAGRMQRFLSGGWEEVFRLVLLVRDGAIPTEALRMEMVWADLATPSVGAIGDFLVKMNQTNTIPGASRVARDIAGQAVGLTQSEIDLLDQADRSAVAQSFIQRLGLNGLNGNGSETGTVADGTQPIGTPAN